MLYDTYTWPSCFEELMSYLPGYYRGNLEMEAVQKAAGSLGGDIMKATEHVLDQAFVARADETTISNLEQWLGIALHKSRSLEDRKRLLTAYMSGSEGCGAQTIKAIIKAYTGTDADIRLEPFDEAGNNRLYIDIPRGSYSTVFADDLNFLIDRKIPAHIEYRAEIIYIFGTVCSYHRKHYKIDYELCGTKPEIATIGSFGAFAVAATKKISTYTADLPQASSDKETGTIPDVADKGLYGAYITAAEAQKTAYLTDYQSSSEESQTGTTPETATLGDAEGAVSASAVKVQTVSVDYALCGTSYAGG